MAREGEQTGLQQFSDSVKGIVHLDLCLRWQKKREISGAMDCGEGEKDSFSKQAR